MARWLGALLLACFGGLWVWLAVTSFSPIPAMPLLGETVGIWGEPVKAASPTRVGPLTRTEGRSTPFPPKVIVTAKSPGAEVWLDWENKVAKFFSRQGVRVFHPENWEKEGGLLPDGLDFLPLSLPSVAEVVTHCHSWSLSAFVAVAGWRGCPGWDDWADKLHSAHPEKEFVALGVFRGALGNSGRLDLNQLYRFPVDYQFIGGRGQACRPGWVRSLALQVLGHSSGSADVIGSTRLLATLCVADDFEENSWLQGKLSRAMLDAEPWDFGAHPGLMLGLGTWGGEDASAYLEDLRAKPNYFGQSMVMAWCSHLLGSASEQSPAYEIVKDLSPQDRARSAANTMAALDAFKKTGGKDFPLLDLLVHKTLNENDHSVKAFVMVHQLLVMGVEPALGVYLAEELAFQNPDFTPYLGMAAANLRGRSSPQENRLFLQSLGQLEKQYQGIPQSLADIRSARMILHADG